MKPQGRTSAKKARSSAESRVPAQPKIAARWLSASSPCSRPRSLDDAGSAVGLQLGAEGDRVGLEGEAGDGAAEQSLAVTLNRLHQLALARHLRRIGRAQLGRFGGGQLRRGEG